MVNNDFFGSSAHNDNKKPIKEKDGGQMEKGIEMEETQDTYEKPNEPVEKKKDIDKDKQRYLFVLSHSEKIMHKTVSVKIELVSRKQVEKERLVKEKEAINIQKKKQMENKELNQA